MWVKDSFSAVNRCAVHVEHTLKNAEAYLDGTGPAVVLLDNNLPDGLGVESIGNLVTAHPDIKIVLMTADTTDGLHNKAIREGAVRFNAKPFRASDINEIVLSICPCIMFGIAREGKSMRCLPCSALRPAGSTIC